MDDLLSTQGAVALGAAAVALVALVLAVVLALKIRGIRAAQRAVLGEHGSRDLVAHAERLETGFTDLRDWVEESLARLGERASATDTRLDGCVAYHALVRYDAYGEMSGRQSSSLALLDARREGVVITAISHRDHARLYFKQVRDGAGEVELSPEELEAVETALAPAQPATVR